MFVQKYCQDCQTVKISCFVKSCKVPENSTQKTKSFIYQQQMSNNESSLLPHDLTNNIRFSVNEHHYTVGFNTINYERVKQVVCRVGLAFILTENSVYSITSTNFFKPMLAIGEEHKMTSSPMMPIKCDFSQYPEAKIELIALAYETSFFVCKSGAVYTCGMCVVCLLCISGSILIHNCRCQF
jgi:hypothetical protein